ncbi:MAG TPA: alcohol dehydrogenase catalytic domain-containing protein [Mycobacteriales bacterium]|nr:alcohol dehydrogenase catalytic domain-containing protein [Mycobacteriales bacterium]
MRAVVFDTYGGPLHVREVPDPVAAVDGVVVRVRATGVCRSDWHGWQGHDPGIALPHVPGHELAGTVHAVGSAVTRWRVGDRVTAPFVNACGRCPRCRQGDHQVCDAQRQPGFTHWGSFAELVALDAADLNLVALPEGLTFVAAASLGCRFTTAYRAVLSQGRAGAGEWVVVHGCGGVGLSAVQVAVAAGASVVAVDVSEGALALARELGAVHGVRPPAVDEVRRLTGGGAHLSIDALGSEQTCLASIASLRPRGRHVQVGLLPYGPVPVPMDEVLAKELELVGSHGMAAHAYPEVLARIAAGELDPARLVTRELSLDEAPDALASLGTFPGVAVITL